MELTTCTSPTLLLAENLINIPSVTPDDGGCQDLLIKELAALGFVIQKLPFGNVNNFWACRGTAQPLLVFAGHTDVVPPGPLENWNSPPFTATIHAEHLYGRGASDMKCALAAMIIACKNFITQHPDHLGSIGFLITSDEEGAAENGTVKVVEYLQQQNTQIKWCIIGEPTSTKEVGDTIKIGRRGSLHGDLQVFGKQGHIAYPHLADNPIHRSFKALDALTHIEWDRGNADFDPTSLQIYSIEAGTGASNVIPGSLTTRFNFRFSPASNAEQLQQRVHQVFDEHQLHYTIQWKLSSQPFYSPQGSLFQACSTAIQEVCHRMPQASTSGGTSDGRFIINTGCELVELGLSNQTAHQVDEHIKIDDLEKLSQIYEQTLKHLLAK